MTSSLTFIIKMTALEFSGVAWGGAWVGGVRIWPCPAAACVAAMARVQSLIQELPHAEVTAKK